jgi:hypothetical protein
MMTNIYVRGAALGLALFGASAAMAANSAPMTSKALLLKPLTLTKLDDLDFGTLVPSGSGDIVTINADTGARTSPTAGLVTNQRRFLLWKLGERAAQLKAKVAATPCAELCIMPSQARLWLKMFSISNDASPKSSRKSTD